MSSLSQVRFRFVGVSSAEASEAMCKVDRGTNPLPRGKLLIRRTFSQLDVAELGLENPSAFFVKRDRFIIGKTLCVEISQPTLSSSQHVFEEPGFSGGLRLLQFGQVNYPP